MLRVNQPHFAALSALHVHSKSLRTCTFGRGKDSTRLLEFRNFFAGEGLIYFMTGHPPNLRPCRRVI